MKYPYSIGVINNNISYNINMGNKHAQPKPSVSEPDPALGKKVIEAKPDVKSSPSVPQTQPSSINKIPDKPLEAKPNVASQLAKEQKIVPSPVPHIQKVSSQHLEEQKKAIEPKSEQDWVISLGSCLDKQKRTGIQISKTSYGWVICGVLHSSCKFEDVSQLWDQKCVFFNVGSLNLWAFGTKIQPQEIPSQLRAATPSQITLILNISQSKLVWTGQQQKLFEFSLPKQELDHASSWRFFYCASKGDIVEWIV